MCEHSYDRLPQLMDEGGIALSLDLPGKMENITFGVLHDILLHRVKAYMYVTCVCIVMTDYHN